MRYLKKIQILLVAFVLVIGLIGCEGEKELVCDKGQVVENGECVTPEPDPDTEAPVISGTTDIAYTIDDPAPDYIAGLTVSDNEDTSLTIADIVVDSSAVDLTTAGTYAVTFTLTDESGNSVTETINVVVSERELTGEEKATLDIAAIDLDADFTFARSGVNGTSFSWSSSDRQVITNKGFIIKPPIGADPVDVTITLTATNGDYTTTETYTVTVDPREESVVTSQVTVPFESTSEEYIVAADESVNIFYVDNGTVPYIDIEEFFNMVDGAVEAAEVSFTPQNDDELLISFTSEWVDDLDGLTYSETYTLLIDFTDNTLHAPSYDFFGGYVGSTESDFGEGLVYEGYDEIEGGAIDIDMNAYRIDLIIHEDSGETYYLMPFSVADLVFLGEIYYNAWFNGDKIWGVDTFSISGGNIVNETEIRTSSLNSESMEADLKEHTYHFLAMALDHFYGLKMDQDVDTYYDLLVDHADNMLTRTDSTMYKELKEFAYETMNDIHTSHFQTGWYAGPDLDYSISSISEVGLREQAFYNNIWTMQDYIADAGMTHTSMPSHRLIDDGKTAVIYLTGFNIDSPGEYHKVVSLLPETVENIVIDLAYNTGGNVGAVWRIFGYITEQQFMYHGMNPADGSGYTLYYTSDYVAYEEYNYFFTTSGVTFSAGNLMAVMAQELGYPTIGSRTGGGAASIGALTLPNGTVLVISTNSLTAARTGNEVDGYVYESTEFGVYPDIQLSNPYDDDALIAAINEYLASQE